MMLFKEGRGVEEYDSGNGCFVLLLLFVLLCVLVPIIIRRLFLQ